MLEAGPLGEDAVERIIANLDKVKLKLDEAFFYLDEIEELIQEDVVGEEAGAKVGQASERLANELSALSTRVVELQEILRVLQQNDSGGVGSTEAGPGDPGE
ncbi:MAG: hypothetical protein Kow00122_04520 [Thermoleophilia bacterium]|nr:hypothetical protein [Actinomycetota bacterium]